MSWKKLSLLACGGNQFRLGDKILPDGMEDSQDMLKLSNDMQQVFRDASVFQYGPQ